MDNWRSKLDGTFRSPATSVDLRWTHTKGLQEMGMELPTIPCQVVARTDGSRMISSGLSISGNVETNLEITEVERSEKNISLSVWVKMCLRKSALRNMKVKALERKSRCF